MEGNIIYLIVINWASGCEADAMSTEPKAAFLSKADAEFNLPIIYNTIKWKDYYMGTLDIEEVPLILKSK